MHKESFAARFSQLDTMEQRLHLHYMWRCAFAPIVPVLLFAFLFSSLLLLLAPVAGLCGYAYGRRRVKERVMAASQVPALKDSRSLA